MLFSAFVAVVVIGTLVVVAWWLPHVARWFNIKQVDTSSIATKDVVQRRMTKERLESFNARGGAEVVVIGAGIGGMTTAAMLARSGYRVLVVEQHDRIGGATHVFDLTNKAVGLPETMTIDDVEATKAAEKMNGDFVTCEYDSGYHYTCQPFANPLSRPGAFLRYAAGDVKFSDLGDPYDRVMFPHTPECSSNMIGSTEYQFIRGSPKVLSAHLARQLGANYDKVLASVLEKRMLKFYELTSSAVSYAIRVFLVRGIAVPSAFNFDHKLDNWASDGLAACGELSTAYVIKGMIGCGYSKRDILQRKPLPEGVLPRIDNADKLPLDLSDLHEARQQLGARFEDEYRRLLSRTMALAIHPVGDYAAQPHDSSFLAHSFVVNYYRDGSSYPAGSAQDISEGMARCVLSHGGEVFVGANVTRIVRSKSGRAVGVALRKSSSDDGPETHISAATAVVNAAGVYHLYRENGLLRDAALTKRFNEERTFQPSMSHFYVFVALDGSPSSLDLGSTNMWCFQGGGKECDDMDGAFDQFIAEGVSSTPPTVYVTFPCAKNEAAWSQRFPNTSNCIIFCDAKHEWFAQEQDPVAGNITTAAARKQRKRPNYERAKELLRDALLKVLLEKRPDLKTKILWVDTGSPATSEFYLGAFEGADYGTRVDTGYFSRKGLKWLMRADTPVPGLWQSGQDAMTPSISGAMHGGVLAAWRIAGFPSVVRMIVQMMCEQVKSQKGVNRRVALQNVLKHWFAVDF